MPFIMTKVNVPVGKEKERRIKARLGEAIALVPGKSEEYLLAGFEENYHFYLRGDDKAPVAFIEAEIFGSEDRRGYDALTAAITRIFHEELAIPPANIYVKYGDIPVWGAGGLNFDRRQY